MVRLLQAEDFMPHVNKPFSVRGGRHALTLTAVERRGLEPLEARMQLREPFNLIFHGPAGDVLQAGLYTLDVDGKTAFDLHVAPIHTPVRDRQDYQAAFN